MRHQLRFQSLNGSQVRNVDSGLLWGDLGYDQTQSGYVGICRMDINTTVMFARGELRTEGQARPQRGGADRAHQRRRARTSSSTSRSPATSSFRSSIRRRAASRRRGAITWRAAPRASATSAVGAKYAFVRKADAGVAFSIRVRLPTGSLEDMTGTGETTFGVNFIASFERNGWSPHLNVGGLVASGEVFNEVNYNIGLRYRAVQDRLTVGGELVGRRLSTSRSSAASASSGS